MNISTVIIDRCESYVCDHWPSFVVLVHLIWYIMLVVEYQLEELLHSDARNDQYFADRFLFRQFKPVAKLDQSKVRSDVQQGCQSSLRNALLHCLIRSKSVDDEVNSSIESRLFHITKTSNFFYEIFSNKIYLSGNCLQGNTFLIGQIDQ